MIPEKGFMLALVEIPYIQHNIGEIHHGKLVRT